MKFEKKLLFVGLLGIVPCLYAMEPEPMIEETTVSESESEQAEIAEPGAIAPSVQVPALTEMPLPTLVQQSPAALNQPSTLLSSWSSICERLHRLYASTPQNPVQLLPIAQQYERILKQIEEILFTMYLKEADEDSFEDFDDESNEPSKERMDEMRASLDFELECIKAIQRVAGEREILAKYIANLKKNGAKQ